MFYIDKSVIHRREALFFHVIPTFVILIAFLSATVFSWLSSLSAIKKEQELQTEQYALSLSEAIKRRIDAYDNILHSATSIMTFSNTISRQEWSAYVSSLDIEQRFPGVRGIGFSEVIAPQAINSHIEKMKSEGFTDYKIYPEGIRDVYSTVIYIEPFTEVNRQILGYDMLSEDMRQQAMKDASETGKTVATNVVTLMQDQLRGITSAGFILYAPLRQNVLSEPSTTSRLSGFVYAPFNAEEFIQNTVQAPPVGYSFSLINKTDDGGEQKIYQDSQYDILSNTRSPVINEKELEFLGVHWVIRATTSGAIISDDTRSRPLITLIGGSLFSCIIAGFVYLLLSNRTRVLAEKEQQGIQDAKEELLALASHQLRTPATGVKQYIGMVREGFAGPLNDTQIKLLQKAYESNERQLATINEMLFVARADAGHLKMDNEEVDIHALISDLLEELRQTFEDRKQNITYDAPRTKVTILGDKPYLRMAIENIFSNASKYTHEKGSIRISLTVHEEVIALQVIDSGVGVSKRDQSLLFKKFSRIPNELTSRVSGSGIGLYLTKKVIDAHNGRIIFHSEENKGSEITILLPIAPHMKNEITELSNSRSKHHGTSPRRPTQ